MVRKMAPGKKFMHGTDVLYDHAGFVGSTTEMVNRLDSFLISEIKRMNESAIARWVEHLDSYGYLPSYVIYVA